MKKFIAKISIITGVLIVIGIGIEMICRYSPNDYLYKSNYLKKQSDDIELLIIGASDANFGINPDYFDMKAFNAAHVSQSMNYEYAVFEKYFDKFSNLKCIIVTVSYPFLWLNLDEGFENWRSKYYSIYYGVSFHTYDPYYNCYLSSINLGVLSNAINNLGKQEMPKGLTSKGFGTTYNSNNQNKKWKEETNWWVSLHRIDTLNTILYKENVSHLDNICKMCNDKNIDIIIVNPPTWHGYYSQFNQEQYNEIVRVCSSLDNKYAYVHYFNMFKDEHFVDNDFYDACHLIDAGAAKLSKILNEWIKDNIHNQSFQIDTDSI